MKTGSVFILSLLVLFSSPCSGGTADRASTSQAHIVLEKRLAGRTGQHREVVVRAGDSLTGLLASMGFTPSNMEAALRLVADLNPGIENLHRIFPGQKISLPPLTSTSPKESGRPLLPVLDHAFRSIGETLVADGMLSLPLSRSETITLDNEAFPLLDFSTGRGILLDFDDSLPEDWQRLIEKRWPHYRIVKVPAGSSLSTLIERILDESGYHSVTRKEPVHIGKDGRVRIVPDFLIARNPDSLLEGNLYLLLINDPSEDRIPKEIREIAGEHLMTVVEIAPGRAGEESTHPPSSPPTGGGWKYTASDYRTLLGELGPALGLKVGDKNHLRSLTAIRLGQVSAPEHAVFLEGRGRACLVLFGPSEPSLPSMLEREGVGVLSVGSDDSFDFIMGRLLHFFGYEYSGPLVEFFPPGGRYSLHMPGFYILHDSGQLLLTGEEVSPRLRSFLAARGIEVVTCLLP